VTHSIRIGIEEGSKKSFASALDYPGWCRWGRTPQDAMDALSDYRERYNDVLSLEHIRHVPADTSQVEIMQTVAGNATTEYGAPDKAFDLESEPLAGPDFERVVRIVRGSWAYLDQTAGKVSEALQKGPRGGGRDRSKMLLHVLEAERSYVRSVGVKTAPMSIDDRSAIVDHRDAVIAAIQHFGASGEELPKRWPLRYFIRRMVWHTLDHAWEMQDKDLSGKAAP
jgi:hypothetical protein